jgi:hypothetical protein
MSRTKGAKNVVPFDERTEVATSTNAQVKHIAEPQSSPLEHFRHLLRHQQNFLKWIDSRHDKLQKAQKELAELKNLNRRGPKDAVYRKYRWYTEELVLLEAINNFEVFYKRSLIELASALKEFIPPGNIKGAVAGKVIWSVTGDLSAPSLLFESQLFHDLSNVDKATRMLLGKCRYKVNSPDPAMKSTVKALQAIFQIRHTLSHNGGLVTDSDHIKLKVIGYDAPASEIVDPTKNHLGKSIFRLLQKEANAFTKWLRGSTIDYLNQVSRTRGLEIPQSQKDSLVKLLGGSSDWDTLPWAA